MARVLEPGTAMPEFRVVGVGASAGGITALQDFFSAIRGAPNLAFVVLQHLTSDRPSQLPHLIGHWTSMRVREAADGVAVEPGCVFVAPPGRALLLEHGVFATRARDGASPRAGIDIIDSFFDSVALDCRARAIGVVLSGTGADGAAGAVRIKQAGGLVLVQDPATATHDGMPSAVIANGAADYVMPIGDLAHQLVACASSSSDPSASAASWAEDASEAIADILDLLRTKTGLDLTGYKTTPLVWRIQRRMEFRRVPDFRVYETLLRDDPAELETLVRGIPIHVTEFFRDEAAWELLQDKVIADLFRNAGSDCVRAWTPACSTGEEAYSVAMLLAEQAGMLERAKDFQVFATDVSTQIVARASRGIFKPHAMRGVSPERRERFFYPVDGAYRARRPLREKMVFAPQDLLADPPFAGLDFVSCRNLLIYLDQDAADRVVYLLHSSLRMGGYLFLGRGESLLSRQRAGFDEIGPGTRIYRKTGAPSRVVADFPRRPVRLRAVRTSRVAVEAHTHEAALEERGLAAVVVDDDFQLVRVYGDTSPFLHLKPGEPSLNLLRLMPAAAGLEQAARAARAQECAVVLNGFADPATGEPTLSLRVTPLPAHGGMEPQLLVSFIRDGKAGAGDIVEHVSGNPERMVWNDALRLSHEELEASREELQALNEELRASNDQLNIANDHLNEANAQLQENVDALQLQSNVLSSGEITTLFLDEALRIRWYTPAACDLFPMKPGDIGRAITDLSPKFPDAGFVDDIHAVKRDGVQREAEVRAFSGHWYLERIRPFRAAREEDACAGVAITFTDITELKRIEAATKRLHGFSTAAIEARNAGDVVELAIDVLMQLHDADLGTVQLYDEKAQALRLASQRGFEPWFIEHFAAVDATGSSACGQALARRARVCIRDVDADSEDEAFCAIARRAGFRAVQSTPVTGAAGQPLGMLSTYFREPRTLTEAESRLTDILANELSIALERVRVQQALRESEDTLRRNQRWISAQNDAFLSEMSGAPLEASLGILVRAAVEQSGNEARCAFYFPAGQPAAELDAEAPGCWSFPVETTRGRLVGTFTMQFDAPRDPSAHDREFVASLTRTAAIIISRHPHARGGA